jgi:hypothetical protein
VGKGTGLGLSQVYGFASQIGGNLMLRSAPGEGTRAVITSTHHLIVLAARRPSSYERAAAMRRLMWSTTA